tara:strand:- start:540 stop:1577 length:1038 start_codon:yes stop_codon:yes gene_type:complete
MSDFTIIITSFNRPKCLLRNLKFLLSHDLTFEIIIADSSNNLDINDELKNLINKNNVLFKSFPHEIKVAQKISKAIKYASTKYCVLCAEDDFILPSSIIKCVHFLKNNSEYSSCHGRYYTHIFSKYVKKFGITFRNLSKLEESCEENSPIDRIDTYLSGKLNSQYTFYAVFETINLQTIWEQTSIYANDWFLNEYFPTIVSLIMGKMKTLPILYMSREPNSYNWHSKEKLELLLSKEANMRCSEGIVKNIIKQYPNLDSDELKKNYFNYFEVKKHRMIKNKLNTNPEMNKDNIIKYFLRRFVYLYLKVMFKIKNKSNSDSVRKIENLVIESGDIINEVKNSRGKY